MGSEPGLGLGRGRGAAPRLERSPQAAGGAVRIREPGLGASAGGPGASAACGERGATGDESRGGSESGVSMDGKS